MKSNILNKVTFWLLMLAVITAGCNDNIENEETVEEDLCLYVNIENIDKTIPIINEFLSGLSDELNDEQQLQKLVAWLKSCACIIDAVVLSQQASPTSEIVISFDEDGITKEFIFDVSMEKPLKVAGVREYEEPEICEFCSFVNVKNIDKTIPFINEFLNELSDDLDDEDQLQELAAWLKLRACIIDAAVLSLQTEPTSEIVISFDEDGITKEFILDVSMEKPLKVAGYNDYEPFARLIGEWDCIRFAYTADGKIISDVADILSTAILSIVPIPDVSSIGCGYEQVDLEWHLGIINWNRFYSSITGNLIKLKLCGSTYVGTPVPHVELDISFALPKAHSFFFRGDELFIYFEGEGDYEQWKDYFIVKERKNLLILKKR